MTVGNTATVRALGARLVELADTLEDTAARARLRTLLERTQGTGLFQLVVVGEIKKGKSSFINALLGHPDLLPALSDVATSTVYRVGWGEQVIYRIHFQPQDPQAPSETTPPSVVIEAAEVAAYGTEDGNPNNQHGVDFIDVELPHPLLKQGLTIIDTPGLGGLFKSHAEILWRYAPTADAVFFVLDSVEAIASRPEMDALERLRRMTSLLYFVQTKIDLAPQEQWREWCKRNLVILAANLHIPLESLRYFPLSAKLKHAADRRQSPELLRESGYEALQRFIQMDLMAFKDAYLASQLAAFLTAEAVALNQHGMAHKQALTTKTQDELSALDRDAQTAREIFRKWKETTYRELKREFERRSKSLKREQSNELQNRLDPGIAGPVVGPIMAQLRATEESPDRLVARSDEFRSQVIDCCAGEMVSIHDVYQQRMQDLLTVTTEQMGAALNVAIDVSSAGLRIDRESVSVEASTTPFERTRLMFRGASASSGMVGFALVGYGAVFAPVAAIVVVPTLLAAALAGIIFSYKEIEDKRRDKVLIKLQNVLSDNVRAAQRQATQQFNMLADRFEYAAIDALNQVVEIRTARLDDQLSQIETVRRQATEERSVLGEHLKEHLARLDALIQDLDQARQSLSRLITDASTPKNV